MQTNLAEHYRDTHEGREAEAILRKCVHCGFCTATCPTYQLLGDELDGPRGRIYLIKQVLEGKAPTRATQQHLDRCLTCRNCETTCPSGVQYGHLLDIGRAIVERTVERPLAERASRWALREGLNSAAFAPAMKLGQALRPMLPAAVQAKVPQGQAPRPWPTRTHARKVLLPRGCVQPAMLPNIDVATARVLDAAGIQAIVPTGGGCCGALRFHLNESAGALAQMRANIDAWWPHVERDEIEAIVSNASGCGVQLKDYGHALRHDPVYAEKAARVAARVRDLSECLPEIASGLQTHTATALRRIAQSSVPLVFHPPCTLQHGQGLRGGVEAGLRALGFSVRLASTDAHLCCGSAGTYSVLQPVLSTALRERKLAALAAVDTETIVSANIGCVTHLQAASAAPVRHWIEVLDDALTQAQPTPA